MPAGREDELPSAIAQLKRLREENKLLREELRRVKSKIVTSASSVLHEDAIVATETARNGNRVEHWLNKSQWSGPVSGGLPVSSFLLADCRRSNYGGRDVHRGCHIPM